MSNYDLGAPIGGRRGDGLDGTEAGEHGRGVGVSGGHGVANAGNTQSGGVTGSAIGGTGGSSDFNAGLGAGHASAGIPKQGEHPIADKFMGSSTTSGSAVSGAYAGTGAGDALTGQSHAHTTGSGVGYLGENTRSGVDSGLGSGNRDHTQSGALGSGVAGAGAGTAIGGAYAGGAANDGLTGQSDARTTGAGVGPQGENIGDNARAAAMGATAGGAAGLAGAPALPSSGRETQSGVGPAGGAGGHYSTTDSKSASHGSGTAAGLGAGAGAGAGAAAAGTGVASNSPLVKESEATGHYGTVDNDSSRGQPLSDPKELDSGGRHGLVFQESTGKYVHRHELEDAGKKL